jgi:hypothetical protein
VHDAHGVGLGDGFAGLEDVVHGFADGERAAVRELRREITTPEVLHDHERGAVLESTDVDDTGDVLALDAGRGARLPPEALDDFRHGERVRKQALDGEALVEVLVPDGDDDAHTAPSEDPLDEVFSPENRAYERFRHEVAFFGPPVGLCHPRATHATACTASADGVR